MQLSDLSPTITQASSSYYTPTITARPLTPSSGGAVFAYPPIVNIPPSWTTAQTTFHYEVHEGGVIQAIGVSASSTSSGIASAGSLGSQSVPVAGTTLAGSSSAAGGIAFDFPVLRTPGAISAISEPGNIDLTYSVQGILARLNGSIGWTVNGDSWLSAVEILDDVVVAGQNCHIRIKGAFLNGAFPFSNFMSTGDYVHFFNGTSDLAVDNFGASVANDETKINILSEVLTCDSQEPMRLQTLDLYAYIGTQVPGAILDVDINCGAIQAYSDPLSQANNLKGSLAHRLHQSLKVTVWDNLLVYVADDGTTQTTNDFVPPTDLPYPNIDLQVTSATITTDSNGNQNGVDIAYTVTVTDPASEVAKASLQMGSVSIFANDLNIGSLTLAYQGGDGIKPRTLNDTQSGTVHYAVVPFDNVFFRIEGTNAAGYRGYSTWNIPVMTDYTRQQPSGDQYRYLLAPQACGQTPIGTLRVYYPVTLYNDANYPTPNQILINGNPHTLTKNPVPQLLNIEDP